MQMSLFLRQRTLRNKRHRDQAQLLQKAYNLAVAALNKGRTPHLDTVLVRDYQVPANQLSAIRFHTTNRRTNPPQPYTPVMNSVTYLTLREDTLRALREFRLTDALRSLNGQLRQLAGADELQHRYRVLNSEYTDLLSELRAGGGVPRVKAQQYAFLQETYPPH